MEIKPSAYILNKLFMLIRDWKKLLKSFFTDGSDK